MKRYVTWLLTFAGILCAVTQACISPPARPTDADLVLQFRRDSANYHRVITMLAADTNIGMITPDFIWRVGQASGRASAPEVGITEARLTEYRRTLGALGVIALNRWNRDVMFATWSYGFAGNTHHRGIAWLHEPASEIGWRRFRVIAGPWYMFED